MIEKNKKTIINERGYVLDVTQDEINIYLDEVKEAIRNNRYRIDRNLNRQDNINLFLDYVIDETMAKDILLGLTATDFSERVRNRKPGYEHEVLYIFGKDAELLERMENSIRTVPLYIRFNKTDTCYVIVVSMHEQKYPIKYYFK